MPDEQPQPAPKVYKKAVTLRFADLEVYLATEDSHDLSELNLLAMENLAIMIKDRVAYSSVFDTDQGDSGGIPDDTTKPLMPTAEPQRLEVRMYQ